MSLSRAEIEAMDKDELAATIVELSQQVADQQARIEAYSRWKDSARDELHDLADRVEDLEAENQRLRERLDDAEVEARQAMTVASRGHDPDSRSKTEVAKHLTRNELVRRCAAGGPAQDRPLTIRDVRDRAAPEHELAWETVNRAWGQLREEWPMFRETSTDGNRALTLSAGDVTPGLARAVGADLDRPDLTKRFVGDNGGGVS